jgi:hypothetical protein
MIQKIYDLGDDAFQNLFKVTFSVEDEIPELSLRIQDFPIPGSGSNTYEVNYMTQVMTKVGGKVDAPQSLSFNVRLDASWGVYNWLIEKKNLKANPATGKIGAQSDGIFNTVVVPVDSEGEPLTGDPQVWTFYNCWIQNLGDVSFDYASGEPITIPVTMFFLYMSDDKTTSEGAAV